MKLIYNSPVDLMAIYQDEAGIYILEITDFGHDQKADRRIIPNDKINEFIGFLNAKESCEKLSRTRSTLKRYR